MMMEVSCCLCCLCCVVLCGVVCTVYSWLVGYLVVLSIGVANSVGLGD